MDRRYFLQTLATGIVAATAPSLFLPKLSKPAWKVPTERRVVYTFVDFWTSASEQTMAQMIILDAGQASKLTYTHEDGSWVRRTDFKI